MVQVIEMNQEIKCKNPTTEKVVLAGFCLVPVLPLSEASILVLSHMNLDSGPWFLHTGNQLFPRAQFKNQIGSSQNQSGVWVGRHEKALEEPESACSLVSSHPSRQAPPPTPLFADGRGGAGGRCLGK